MKYAVRDIIEITEPQEGDRPHHRMEVVSAYGRHLDPSVREYRVKCLHCELDQWKTAEFVESTTHLEKAWVSK